MHVLGMIVHACSLNIGLTIILCECVAKYSIIIVCKANQTTLLVSRPPVFLFLCGRAVIIHYSLFNIMAF